MSEFLSGEELSEKIKHVCSGKNVRIAAAFWGVGAVDTLFGGDPKDALIICDISMGGTNPKELEHLGAPDNRNLRFLDGLHAKVYLSDNGCVVGSANASNNGVGFFGAAKHIDAGVYHDTHCTFVEDVGSWFDDVWNSDACLPLNKTAMEKARSRWANRARSEHPRFSKRRTKRPLLDVARTTPEILDGWGVVFSMGDYESPEAVKKGYSGVSDGPDWSDAWIAEGCDELSDFPRYMIAVDVKKTGQSTLQIIHLEGQFAASDDETNCWYATTLPWVCVPSLSMTATESDEEFRSAVRAIAHLDADDCRWRDCRNMSEFLKLIDELK